MLAAGEVTDVIEMLARFARRAASRVRPSAGDRAVVSREGADRRYGHSFTAGRGRGASQAREWQARA